MNQTHNKFLSLLDDSSIMQFTGRLAEIERRLAGYRTKLRAISEKPASTNWVKPPATWIENCDVLKTIPQTVGAYMKENPNLACRPIKIVPTLIPGYFEPAPEGECAALPEMIEQIKADVLEAIYYFTDIRIACELLHPPLISDEHSVLKPILALEFYAGEQVKAMRDAMLKVSNYYAERANARILMYEHAQSEVIQFNSLNFEQDFADSVLLIVQKIYNSYVGLFMRVEKDYEDIVKFKTLKAQKTQEVHQFYQ